MKEENLDEKVPVRAYTKPTLPCFTIPVYVLLPPYNFSAGGFMLTGN